MLAGRTQASPPSPGKLRSAAAPSVPEPRQHRAKVQSSPSQQCFVLSGRQQEWNSNPW